MKIKPSKQTRRVLPLSALKIHRTIQRHFDKRHAKHIQDNFNPDAVGELRAVQNDSGFYVWDGQHRLAAMRALFGEDATISVLITPDITVPEAAAVQRQFNKTKRWNAIDQYKIAFLSGEKWAVCVKKKLAHFDLKIGNSPTNGFVAAVAALQRVYERCGPEILMETIQTIYDAWGDDYSAYHANIIRGVSVLINRYDADSGHLSKKLRSHVEPDKLIGEARSFAKTVGCTAVSAMLLQLTKYYNIRRAERNKIEMSVT